MVKNYHIEPATGLARSGAPQSPQEVDWLYEQGIRTVVSVHPVSEEVQARMMERGIEWKPFLVTDFAEGAPQGLAGLLAEIGERSPGESVLIHCQGGGGRAGTLHAGYLIRQGVPVEEAIRRVPGVDGEVRKAFLYGFAAGLESGRDDSPGTQDSVQVQQ